MNDDDVLAAAEAEMLQEQREAWAWAAARERRWMLTLRERAIHAGEPHFEFMPPEVSEALERAAAYEHFTAVTDFDDGAA